MKRALLVGACIAVLVPVVLLGWLLTTESGLRWAYRTASPWIPAEFSSSEISGVLAGPITLRDVAYEDRRLAFGAIRVDLDWNPWALMTWKLEITELRIESLEFALPEAPAAGDQQPAPLELPSVSLPVALQLADARIESVDIRYGDSEFRIERVALELDARAERFEITRLDVESAALDASLDGAIEIRGEYPHDLGFKWQGSLPSGAELSGEGRIAGDLSSTRLEQQLQGALRLRQTLELDDLLSAPRWRSGIEVAEFDSRGLDPDLPQFSGALQANLEGDLDSASGTGSLQAETPRLGAFAANFRLQSLDGARRYDGLLVDKLTIDALEGEISAQGRVEWAPVPGWKAAISTSGIDPSGLFAEWPGRLDANLDTSGKFDNQRLQANVRIGELRGSLRDYPVSARGKLQWDDGMFDIEALEIGSGDTRIEVAGRAGETLDLEWQLRSGDLGEIYPDTAGSLDADGVLRGRRDSPRIDARFEGRAIVWRDYQLGQANGRISLDPLQLEHFEIRLSAREVRIQDRALQSLDLAADPQRVDASLSTSVGLVRIGLEGSLDGYNWHGNLVEAIVESRDYSDWKLRAPTALSLSPKRIEASQFCLQGPRQGKVCASVDGQPENWDIALDVSRLPLSLLAQLTPARFEIEGLADARAKLAYRPSARQLLGSIDVQLQPGRTRLQPTEEQWLQLIYQSGNLDLQLKSSQIAAKTELTLTNGDRLEASAQLPGAGLLNLDPANQSVAGTLTARVTDFTIVEALFDEFDRLSGRLELEAEFAGELLKPRVRGEARISDASLRIVRLDTTLDDMNIVARGDASETLDYNASASIGAGRIELVGDTRLDASAGWPSNLRLVSQDIAAAKIVQHWMPEEVSIDGRFDSKAELQFSAPRSLRGKIDFASATGVLNYPLLEDVFERWEYHDARLELVLRESGISGEAGVLLGTNNRLEGQLNLPRAGLLTLDPASQALEAQARLELNDFEIIQALVPDNAQLEFNEIETMEVLIPDIAKPRGRLTLEIDAAGTLTEPRLTGRAELSEAKVSIPRLGLQITQISLTGVSDLDGRFNFELDARSGDGTLRLEGSSLLDAASGWPTRIKIKGDNFEAARIPEASVNLSPDLLVEIKNRTIDISGDLHVPFARLQPRDVTTADKVSNDTVVIGGDKPVDDDWLVTTRINLILGERVAFYGFGFDGRLAGRLLIEQQPGQLTSGTGEISIPEGRYRAYGQRLDIANGRVLFTGGPVTNPGLDIRATRDSNGVITGLLVRGRLRQPHIELFSIPAMGQTDTLSYLLFGRPMETASGEDSALMAQAALTLGLAGGDHLARSLRERFGLDEFRVETDDSGDQASLVVGRYLSPDVYVSYAVGLIESVNSLNLRYRITDRWQLEAESGLNHGADLLYTIER